MRSLVGGEAQRSSPQPSQHLLGAQLRRLADAQFER